jgi:hypothetical protein
MSHTDFGQSGVASACGYQLTGAGPLALLVGDLARSLTEADFTDRSRRLLGAGR